ncbi:hypothetical protein [Croceivirga sp. JEA036]|uniref:hypothetical protein n=1 Tax=Croceivirga sp. JEA036 TaxID=2721162 RepID=UPI00143B2ADB|nr:hypothetical protein [Croceivirga sp. JEA036]NJB37286.1 hypothetical protein [Croceivirga sp. JEA036]
MALWEIDEIIISGIELIKQSELEPTFKKHVLWNLENIPELYGFDAGMFNRTELDIDFSYERMNIYNVGYYVIAEAKKRGYKDLVYDWSAFLLNFREGYFAEIAATQELKEGVLKQVKLIFESLDFSDYEPIHRSLTIYQNGMDWYSEDQKALVKWFCTNNAAINNQNLEPSL